MTNQTASRHRPDSLQAPVNSRPDAQERSERRAVARGAAGPRWLKLGLAAALGVVAGAMLCPTPAEGEERRRRGI